MEILTEAQTANPADHYDSFDAFGLYIKNFRYVLCTNARWLSGGIDSLWEGVLVLTVTEIISSLSAVHTEDHTLLRSRHLASANRKTFRLMIYLPPQLSTATLQPRSSDSQGAPVVLGERLDMEYAFEWD